MARLASFDGLLRVVTTRDVANVACAREALRHLLPPSPFNLQPRSSLAATRASNNGNMRDAKR